MVGGGQKFGVEHIELDGPKGMIPVFDIPGIWKIHPMSPSLGEVYREFRLGVG